MRRVQCKANIIWLQYSDGERRSTRCHSTTTKRPRSTTQSEQIIAILGSTKPYKLQIKDPTLTHTQIAENISDIMVGAQHGRRVQVPAVTVSRWIRIVGARVEKHIESVRTVKMSFQTRVKWVMEEVILRSQRRRFERVEIHALPQNINGLCWCGMPSNQGLKLVTCLIFSFSSREMRLFRQIMHFLFPNMLNGGFF